jgi:hypothetical protein
MHEVFLCKSTVTMIGNCDDCFDLKFLKVNNLLGIALLGN